MKRKSLIAFLLCVLTFFLAIQVNAAAEKRSGKPKSNKTVSFDTESASPELKKLDERLFYIEALHRYVQNPNVYPSSRASACVRMFNRAIDSLQEEIPVSLYFVESSRSHLITHRFDENSEYYLYLQKHLHADRSDHLKYTTLEEFCDFFYSTDHNWNYQGAYQGYCDIVRLLLGENEPLLEPVETVTLPVIFNGSFSKNLNTADSTEQFSLYRFDKLPEYTCFVNGKKHAYDHIRSYLAGKYNRNTFANHYALCYGGTFAFGTMETDRTDAPNLLVFCNSMGAGVNYLLANHFHRIVIVDLRYYKETFEDDFSLENAVKEYDIDQILILGDAQFFYDAKNLIP